MDSVSEDINYPALWRSWILQKREEAHHNGKTPDIRRWDGVLAQYLESTGLETYISPFTGRET